MVTELNLGTIQTYGTLSGYVYLHLPQYLVRQLDILPATRFSIIYRDGRLVLEQVKEEKDAV